MASVAPPPPVRIPTTRPAPSTTTDRESPLAEKAPDELSKGRIDNSLETTVSLSEKYLRVYVMKVVARPTVRPVVLPRLRTTMQASPFWSYIFGCFISSSPTVPQSFKRRSRGKSKLWEFFRFGCIMQVSTYGEYLVPRSITLPANLLGSILEASIAMTATSWVYCCCSVSAPTTIGGEKKTWPKVRLVSG